MEILKVLTCLWQICRYLLSAGTSPRNECDKSPILMKMFFTGSSRPVNYGSFPREIQAISWAGDKLFLWPRPRCCYTLSFQVQQLAVSEALLNWRVSHIWVVYGDAVTCVMQGAAENNRKWGIDPVIIIIENSKSLVSFPKIDFDCGSNYLDLR